MKIAHMFFLAHIFRMMSLVKKKGTLITHKTASALGIGVGENNALCYRIAEATPGWFITYTEPNVFGLATNGAE